MGRYALSDADWERLAPLLPGRPGTPGRSGDDNRRFLDAVNWIARNGGPWRDLPARFGRWNSVFQRFRRWVKGGVFERIFACLVLLAASWLEAPILAGLVVTLLTMAAGYAVAGLAIHPRLFLVTLAMLGGALAVALWPSLAYATLVGVLLAAVSSLAATDAPCTRLSRWGIGR